MKSFKLWILQVCFFSIASLTGELGVPAEDGPRGFGESGNVYLQILRAGTLMEAQDIVRKIKAGSPFEDLASVYAPEGLKERAGFLGEVQVETFHPELQKAISTLPVGEVSSPIRTEDGYIILRRLAPESAAPYGAHASSAMDYFLLGLSLDGSKEEDQEIESYRKAIELAPNMKEAYVNLGEALRRKAVRLMLESQKDADRAFKMDEAVLEMLDESIDNLKIALSLDPKMIEARYNLGLAYAAEGIFGLAVLEFQEAAGMRPEDGEIQKALASVFYLMGELDKALVHAMRAKEMRADVAGLISAIERERMRRSRIQPEK